MHEHFWFQYIILTLDFLPCIFLIFHSLTEILMILAIVPTPKLEWFYFMLYVLNCCVYIFSLIVLEYMDMLLRRLHLLVLRSYVYKITLFLS